MKKLFLLMILITIIISMTGCARDSDIASRNLSVAATMFQVDRRIVFYNGITGDYILTIEGKCALDVDVDGDLNVTCKTGENSYKKHFLGLSDNVTYFAEQINPNSVSVYHYKVIFKPEVIIPDIDLSTSGNGQ